jgi:hypothetical protein
LILLDKIREIVFQRGRAARVRRAGKEMEKNERKTIGAERNLSPYFCDPRSGSLDVGDIPSLMGCPSGQGIFSFSRGQRLETIGGDPDFFTEETL